MDDLRRKFVLGSSLFTVGLLSGCGGGDQGNGQQASAEGAGDMLTAQAAKASVSQTLHLAELKFLAGLDAIWQSTQGGSYLVPSAIPKWQAVVNGSALYLSVVETVQVSSSTKLIRNMVVTLDNGAGTVPALNSAYTLNRNSAASLSSARMSVLKRVTAPSTGVISDELYHYQNDVVTSGTVKITAVTPTTPDIVDGPVAAIYKVHFEKAKFLPVPGSLSSKGFLLTGDTTLQAATETSDWM
jgi:hypothetical protein